MKNHVRLIENAILACQKFQDKSKSYKKEVYKDFPISGLDFIGKRTCVCGCVVMASMKNEVKHKVL